MKKIAYGVRFLITCFLLYFVCEKVGLFNSKEREELYVLLGSVSLLFLTYSFAVSFLLNLSSGFKWYLLLRSRDIRVSFFRCYALYMVGIFFSLFLPTSMGGDVVRIHELGKYTGQRAKAAASVFVERFTGMIILFLLALIALLFQSNLISTYWLSLSVVVAIVASIAIIWGIIDNRPYTLITSFFSDRGGLFQKIFEKIDSFHQALSEYKEDSFALAIAIGNTFIFYFLAIVNVWVTACAFEVNVNFIQLIIAVPLIMFIMNLPISIGGLGLMEFAFIFIFSLFGYSSELALSTALLMRLKSFVDGGIGGIFYVFFIKSKSKS